MQKIVRVRFAPSPTGALHIGGVRTALYNYLFARKYQGQFIVRIEDTDRARFVASAEAYILDTLKWLGLEADEDPVLGGAFGPYRQSERTALYQKYVHQLVATGKAYYAFDTPEELDAMRKRLQAAAIQCC
jgi:glutamyl-tRNA synthetase